MILFEVQFLESAKRFLDSLDNKTREKVLINIIKSRKSVNPSIFKKVSGEIWEFRTRYNGKQYRLLAFWDKDKIRSVLVFATHGFVKKTSKIPRREIKRAQKLRSEYFKLNNSNNG